jgi:CRISPR-associated protein Csh1
MITAVKSIGERISDKPSEYNIEGIIVFIVIDTIKQSFVDIILEEFNNEKVDLYLYQPGASKGNAPALFVNLAKKEPIKAFTKIENWFKKSKDQKALTSNQTPSLFSQTQASLDYGLLVSTYDILNKNKDIILNAIIEKVKNLPKEKLKKLFLSAQFNQNMKYLGEYDIVLKSLQTASEEKRDKSSSSNQCCCICGFKKSNVSAKGCPYAFLTDDKPGFITGGFKEKDAWKNHPICDECAAFLSGGKIWIEQKLKFTFYGLTYYLIPKSIIHNETLDEIVTILQDSIKTQRLKEKIKKRITNCEDEILEYVAEQNDFITVNFLFLEKSQSAERILLHIEDVFPSRVRRIFDAKTFVDEFFQAEFNFGTIRHFFKKSDENKREDDLDKYFLEIIDSVFKGKKIDFDFIIRFYLSVIRKELIKDKEGYFHFRVKDALMNTLFFEQLRLITFQEVKNMVESDLNQLFERYGKSFGSLEKRGIFLVGSLTQLLLNKQYQERGARPFIKKLKSLKMDEQDIKALLPKIQSKLEEYESFDKGKRTIAESAYKYLLQSGDNWKLSADEINYYFACGMNLYTEVANIVYQHNENTEE